MKTEVRRNKGSLVKRLLGNLKIQGLEAQGLEYGSLTLRVHVPKKCILWAQCTCIGSTLRPMYILYEYMDP